MKRDLENCFVAELALPPGILSPNIKVAHWAQKSKAVKKYRSDCHWRYLLVKPREWKPCPVIVTIEYRCGYAARGLSDVAPAVVRMQARRSGKTETAKQYAKLMASRTRRAAPAYYAPLDEDNARSSCKALQDALRDAGIIGNDTPEWITIESFVLIRTLDTKPDGVTVTVRAR